jgi:hypothetical protein
MASEMRKLLLASSRRSLDRVRLFWLDDLVLLEDWSFVLLDDWSAEENCISLADWFLDGEHDRVSRVDRLSARMTGSALRLRMFWITALVLLGSTLRLLRIMSELGSALTLRSCRDDVPRWCRGDVPMSTLRLSRILGVTLRLPRTLGSGLRDDMPMSTLRLARMLGSALRLLMGFVGDAMIAVWIVLGTVDLPSRSDPFLRLCLLFRYDVTLEVRRSIFALLMFWMDLRLLRCRSGLGDLDS